MTDIKIEVLSLAVSDVDRAVAFYTERAGFNLDVDYQPNDGFHVVQLTPPGSSCSIQLGVGITDATPGSVRNTCLLVDDLASAHRELTARGLPVSPIRHKASVEDWQGTYSPGIDPEHRNYASFSDFADPDGNTWVIQEVGYAGR
jgi:catechol 2,3-dioxygenase-like lactoylglutathione lyase family enzyme